MDQRIRVDKVRTASVRCNTSCKEPLSMYSRMMAVFGETVHAPSHKTIDGCRKVDKTETSRLNSSNPLPTGDSNSRFTATRDPLYRPKNTSPKPPLPIRLEEDASPFENSMSSYRISHSSASSITEDTCRKWCTFDGDALLEDVSISIEVPLPMNDCALAFNCGGGVVDAPSLPIKLFAAA